MVDKQFPTPRTTLDLLDSVPESLLRRLKQYSGRFSSEAVRAMQDRLPFFAELEASQRASLALVVQTAVANFVEWMTDPHSNVNYTAKAFELLPQDLTRRMPLRHSAELIAHLLGLPADALVVDGDSSDVRVLLGPDLRLPPAG